MAFETTFCIIKPDSFKNKNVGNILSRLEEEGFSFLKARFFRMTPKFCEVFYQEHRERDFFSSLVGFMSSGPIMALALSRENACKHLREVMGVTDPKKALGSSLRALYGTSIEKNAVHGSDSIKSAERELALFFSGENF